MNGVSLAFDLYISGDSIKWTFRLDTFILGHQKWLTELYIFALERFHVSNFEITTSRISRLIRKLFPHSGATCHRYDSGLYIYAYGSVISIRCSCS